MSRRYHYTICLSFGTDGEADYCEIDATVSYTVAWGKPADPWGDDPGSGDEIEDLRLEKVDGGPFTGSATYAAMILDEMERVASAEMLAHAGEVDWADADSFAEARV